MENEKIQDLLDRRNLSESSDRARTPVTILFSDIKGSTSYFEKFGDIAGMAMLERHNSLLFPQIKGNGGRVVKTIGDSIMAVFEDGVGAIKAAVAMQRALAGDREKRTSDEQIHIRVGLHFGHGVLKDNDVYGDVVNAAARLQKQAQPDQILITDVLLEQARSAGMQCAAFGKAEMRGKAEPIDVFAVAWSDSATEQLLEEIQGRFDAKLKEQKRQLDQLEEEYEHSRDQWRTERRNFCSEIEQLEDAVEAARQSAQSQASDAVHAEMQFRLQEAIRAKADVEVEFETALSRWDAERNNLKAQIAAMQGSVIEAMERSNNPARTGMIIREQVEARLTEARQAWDLEWQSERRRLTAEIDRLKKSSGVSDERKEAARMALLQKLGKLPPGSASSGVKTADQLRQELEKSQRDWEVERDRLLLRIKQLENQATRSQEAIRVELFHELQGQMEPKLAEIDGERQRLKFELQTVAAELKDERERFAKRIAGLEIAVAEAQEAARAQTKAELEEKFEVKFGEANRLRSRTERKLQDISEELDSERRRTKRQIAELEEQLKEAKEAAFKANRQFRN
jgi:class 3 adenylate cyclase